MRQLWISASQCQSGRFVESGTTVRLLRGVLYVPSSFMTRLGELDAEDFQRGTGVACLGRPISPDRRERRQPALSATALRQSHEQIEQDDDYGGCDEPGPNPKESPVHSDDHRKLREVDQSREARVSHGPACPRQRPAN